MMMNKMTVVVRRTVVLERLVEVPQAKSKKDAENQAEAIAAGLNDQFSMVKVPGKWRAQPETVVVFANEAVVEEPKKFRTMEEQKALILEAIKGFPAQFRLKAFPDVLCRVGESMKHFFTDHSLEGEMQIVVEALQPDGKWLDFGRNTPEFLHANLMPAPTTVDEQTAVIEKALKPKRVRKPKADKVAQ